MLLNEVSSLQTFIINNISTFDARVLGFGACCPGVFLPPKGVR